MDGAAGYLKNPGVKNARQPVEEKIFNMFRSGTQSKQTNILDTHTKKEIYKYTASRLLFQYWKTVSAQFFEGLGKTKLSISLRASH